MSETYYNNFDDSVQPRDFAYEIDENTSSECANLQEARGTSGSDDSNCDVLQNDLLPAIEQVYYAIRHGNINIYANEDSKCSDNDTHPTIASILSRILRFDQAVSCILCTYDPILIKILKSGTYPQVLMGSSGSVYPQWKTPSTSPSEDSKLPITSGGVYDAIQSALLSVFHKATDETSWVEKGGKYTYDYYAEDMTDLLNQDLTELEEGNIALIKNGEDGTNEVYEWDGSEWLAGDVLDEPNNYAVVEIEKGYFLDKEIYWLHDAAGNLSWNLMDAEVVDIERRLVEVENIYADAVKNADENQYLFGVKDTLAQAQAVPATTGKTTVTLVIGG